MPSTAVIRPQGMNCHSIISRSSAEKLRQDAGGLFAAALREPPKWRRSTKARARSFSAARCNPPACQSARRKTYAAEKMAPLTSKGEHLVAVVIVWPAVLSLDGTHPVKPVETGLPCQNGSACERLGKFGQRETKDQNRDKVVALEKMNAGINEKHGGEGQYVPKALFRQNWEQVRPEHAGENAAGHGQYETGA